MDWNRAAWTTLHVLVLWPLQYLIVVPAILLWTFFVTLVRFALKLGVIGILLLFLPLIGWAILLAWLLFRRPDHTGELVELERRRQGIESRPVRSLFAPWHVGALA